MPFEEADAFFEASLVKKAQSLDRIEPLNQRHAARGQDPTTRKRPDFVVWTKSGEEYSIDIKARRRVSNGYFLLDRAAAKVMSYWKNPIVVFYERTGDLEIDMSTFYVMDTKLLNARLRKEAAQLPLQISQLQRDNVAF